MARRTYTDDDRAAVYIALQVNDGAVAQTSRDTGIPETVVREWRNKWKKDPPQFENIEVVRDDFIERAERIRTLLLSKYEEALEAGKVNADKMPVHIGIFTDKIQLLRGLPTGRHESSTALPSAEQARELVQGILTAVKGAIDAANQRELEIIDVEATESAEFLALPAGTDRS